MIKTKKILGKKKSNQLNHVVSSTKHSELKKLVLTLNQKQKNYVNLNLKNPFNGSYLLSVFYLKPVNKNILQVAAEVAAESSTGTNFLVKTETSFSKKMNAIVYDIDLKKNLVWIAYPIRIFDRGGNIQNILTYLVGNVFGMKELKSLKLLDVWFPKKMLTNYDGPNYNLENVRQFLGAVDRPILGTIIKPKIGLNAREYASVCYDFWVGGGDFVKNDEPQADQDFCDFKQMVLNVKKSMDKAVSITGKKKIHSFNVSSADFDTMIERCDFIISAGFEEGSFAFLVDGITSGWSAVQTIRRRYPNVFLHFHRAGHAAFTRKDNPLGFSNLILAKFARLAGASGLHTGTAGVGKMSGSPREDIVAANALLNKVSMGYFFEQDWFFVKASCPIISGGLNPTLLKKFIDVFGSVDFITTMGAGCHAHPKGTTAGAIALVQSLEAFKQNVSIYDYAKNHKELFEAINFFENKK